MIRHRQMLRALCLCLLMALSGRATAQGETLFADYYAAADQLDHLVGAAAAAGNAPPRLSDPGVAALFARTTDGSRIFDRAYRVEDLPAVAAVMNRGLGFFRLYYSWGEREGMSNADQASYENRNVVIYQNETVPMIGFMFDSAGQLLRTISPGAATLPAEQRAGVSRARNGLIEMLGGMIGFIELPGLTPAHQLVIAQVLDRNGADLAGALSLSQRTAMAGRFEIIRGRVGPQARAVIDHMLRAFNSRACTGLCAI